MVLIALVCNLCDGYLLDARRVRDDMEVKRREDRGMVEVDLRKDKTVLAGEHSL